MKREHIDMSMFQPLYRDAWGPRELMVALAIGLLYRMPERFKKEDVFEPARRSLGPFLRAEPLPNSAALPIKHVRFDGDAVALRDDAAALFHDRGINSGAEIYFDANFDCFIAFADPEDLNRLRPIQASCDDWA